MRANIAAVRSLLKVVTNNGPTAVNGGGTRAAALAPPITG